MTAWGEYHGTRILAVSNSQECLPCRMVTSGVWVVISRAPEIWISYFQKQIHILWFSRIAWVRILQLHNLDLSKTQNKFGIFFRPQKTAFWITGRNWGLKNAFCSKRRQSKPFQLMNMSHFPYLMSEWYSLECDSSNS